MYARLPQHGQKNKAVTWRDAHRRRENYAKMWMMGCGDTASLNNTSDSCHATRRLRPIIPRPHLLHSSHHHSSSPSSTAADFLPLNISPSGIEQSGRRAEGSGAQQAVSSRWNPTPEQLRTLEELYRRGTRTPTAEQIQYITAQLRRFGKIEGKNVFYWFQNHKARERQKRRRQLEAVTGVGREIESSDKKDSSYTSWNGYDGSKNLVASSCRGEERRVEDKWVRWDRELHDYSRQQPQQQQNLGGGCGRTIVAAAAAEREQAASALLLQRMQYSSPPGGALFQSPKGATAVRAWAGGCDREEEVGEAGCGRETLELFPLRSDSSAVAARCCCHSQLQQQRIHLENDSALMSSFVEEQQGDHGRQFFQFLPLKN